jgi:apolipoprotein D and lipocalin family protein
MKSLFSRITVSFCSVITLCLSGCQSTPLVPLATVPSVDLPRFMGDWYVIANIPTFMEKGAHNAIESYHLDADGTIATTFTFRADSFDGEAKRHTPRGFVVNRETNAVWGMQFVWPIKADYYITYLTPDYSQTIVSRPQRDYVWIMARTPSIPAADYTALLQRIAAQGYDITRIQTVPQQWKGLTH